MGLLFVANDIKSDVAAWIFAILSATEVCMYVNIYKCCYCIILLLKSGLFPKWKMFMD